MLCSWLPGLFKGAILRSSCVRSIPHATRVGAAMVTGGPSSSERSDRSPLCHPGARQVGKTAAVETRVSVTTTAAFCTSLFTHASSRAVGVYLYGAGTAYLLHRRQTGAKLRRYVFCLYCLLFLLRKQYRMRCP